MTPAPVIIIQKAAFGGAYIRSNTVPPCTYIMACSRDFMGLHLSCSNEEALRCYNDGLRLLFKSLDGSVSLLERACELDNSLILAHCAVVSIWASSWSA